MRQRRTRSDALPERNDYNANTPCCAYPDRLGFDCPLETCLLDVEDAERTAQQFAIVDARMARVAAVHAMHALNYPPARIARALGCSERTVFRDLSPDRRD